MTGGQLQLKKTNRRRFGQTLYARLALSLLEGTDIFALDFLEDLDVAKSLLTRHYKCRNLNNIISRDLKTSFMY